MHVRKWGAVALGVISLLLLLGAVWAIRASNDTRDHGSPAEQGSQATRVTVVTPTAGGGSRTTTQPASFHSFGVVDLYAKVSGYLANQTVDIGDRVKKAQLLAEIHAPEIQADAESAAAALQRANAGVVQASATVAARQADLKAAQAKVEQSKAELESDEATVTFRTLQYERIKKLAELKSIQEELVDEQAKQLEMANSQLRAGRKAVDTSQAQEFAAEAAVKESQARLKDTQAQVKVAEAALTRAKQFVEYTRIEAPFDGVITKRNFIDGDFIRDAESGGNVPNVALPVLRVARTDLMRVVVQVSDRDASYADPGDAATITVDALPDKNFEGKIARIADSRDYSTRYMRVEIDLENPDGLLQDGMYGSATIVLEKERPGMQIPSSCLVGKEDGSKRALFIARDGKAKRCEVQVGDDDGRMAQVLSGLDKDAQVITGRIGALQDGMPVKIVSDTEQGPQQQTGKPSAMDTAKTTSSGQSGGTTQ